MRNWTVNGVKKMQVGGLVLGLALVLGAAVPAAAEGLDGANLAAATQVSYSPTATTSAFALPADVSFLADATQRPAGTANAPSHQMGGKQVVLDVQFGLISDVDTGIDVGVGGSFLPMKDNDKIEIIADANYVHFGGANGIYISGNGAYDIRLQNSSAVPFVGAGIGIVHWSANGFGITNTNLQLLGGVKFETKSGKALQGQVRFVLGTDSATFLLFGIGF